MTDVIAKNCIFCLTNPFIVILWQAIHVFSAIFQIMEQPSLIHATSEGNVSQYSSSITVSYLDKEGNVMKIANTREFFQIVIPRSPNLPIEEPTPVHPVIPAREWEHLHYHAFSRNDTDNSVHIRILPDNPDVQLLAFVRFGAFPNITLKKWDFMQLIPSNMALKGEKETYYLVCIILRNVSYFIGA